MTYDVRVVSVPRTTLAVHRFHATHADLGSMGEKMGDAFGAVMAHLRRCRLSPCGPAVAYYEPAADGFDVAAGFVVGGSFPVGEGVDELVLPAVDAARTTHVGSYADLPLAYDALRKGVADMGLALVEDGPMWEEYWSTPGTPPEWTRTEIVWPLRTG